MSTLAAHAHSSRVNHATGYSPFQWARGWSREASLPIGLDPDRAFGRTLLLRAKAEESYVKADSAIKLSKLGNTVVEASSRYRPGSVAMLCRARVRKGHGRDRFGSSSKKGAPFAWQPGRLLFGSS